jgi:hypothetical protein
VFVSHDTVFKGDQAWKWSSDEQGAMGGGEDPFMIEFISICDTCTEPIGVLASMPNVSGVVSPTHGGVSPSGESTACTPSPSPPLSPVMPDTVEFRSPSVNMLDLDDDADDAPRQFCAIRTSWARLLHRG